MVAKSLFIAAQQVPMELDKLSKLKTVTDSKIFLLLRNFQQINNIKSKKGKTKKT